MTTGALTIASRFVRRSRWFVAELVVIIAGVLIALAIDEWRSNLADAQRESEYMEQLINDLMTTEEMISAAAVANAVAEEAAGRLVALFEIDMAEGDDKIRKLLADVKFLNNPVPVLGTAEALVSTGDLRLLQNPRIRSELTRYLSRSRDFWLVLIYQLEEEHRQTYYQLDVLAQQYGISSQYRRGQFRNPKTSAGGFGAGAFLADPEAYVTAARLAEQKDTLSS